VNDSPYREPAEIPQEPERKKEPAPPDPYAAAWRDLRRRRTRLGVAFIGAIPAFLLIVIAFLNGAVVGLVGIPIGVLVIGLWLHVSSFACPSCSAPFHPFLPQQLNESCTACGVTIGATFASVQSPKQLAAPLRHIDKAGTSVLRTAIELRYACVARASGSVPVCKVSDGVTLWDGEVQVFDLEGCREAERCYAWSRDDVIFTTLHARGIASAFDAVGAALAGDARVLYG
jgi:hypothetical protein